MTRTTLVDQILTLFPTASGILIFGSQTHAISFSQHTDIDLLITVPTARLKHIHKIAFNGYMFDINLIPEINFGTMIFVESVATFRSSLLDAIITGELLFDKNEIMAAHKELAGLLLRGNPPVIPPELLLQTISTADKITRDIRFKQKSLGQLLLVSLLFHKLIDIELMLNLGTQIVSPKHKSALLKTVNPVLYKKLNSYAFKLEHPNYIQKIYKLSTKLLAGYQTAIQNNNLYEQVYISGKRIVLDITSTADRSAFIHALDAYITKHRLTGISYYYLIAPFKLGGDVSDKLVIKGNALKKIAGFLAAYNKTTGATQPARHQLPAFLFGGENMLSRIELLLTAICHLALQKTFTKVAPFVLGIHFMMALSKPLWRRSFCTYLFDVWLPLSYDTPFTTYTALLETKERTLTIFRHLLQENKDISRFIKTPGADTPWQVALAVPLSKFTGDKLFSHADLSIPSFELKKLLQYTDPQQGKRWFIYRKVLELLFLNNGMGAQDFSFLAFLIKESC